MTADTKPEWIEEAMEAAAGAIASGHARCNGRAVPACKEDCPCYRDAQNALSVFMQYVPLEHLGLQPAAKHSKESKTLRQLKAAFTEKPDAQ